MKFELCSIHVVSSNRPKIYVFMFCIICFGVDQNPPRGLKWVARHYLHYINSHCSGGFDVGFR
jgi:hypothetical protein